jgi:four helix bundle protein
MEEADAGQSKIDFAAKVQISLKEAIETRYWIKLLRDSEFIDSIMAESVLNDCTEIINILTVILKTTKENMRNEK